MAKGRGREAKIRPEFRGLYSGLEATEWKPVEAILRQVAELSPKDRAKAGLGAGPRLLEDQHFEFRGTSPRPEGSPPRRSRVTDTHADPQRLAGLQGQLDAEQNLLTERQREADQTIARAEHLSERADALQQEFERLRQRAAQLDRRPEHLPQEEDAQAPHGGQTSPRDPANEDT
jgi:hypothetical protein